MKRLFWVLLAGWLGLLILQWLTPTVWGADGYFHIRLAEMIKNQGLLKSLPQAQWSYFSDRFSDKDWLYHLFLVPFTVVKNIFTGAKWAAWLGGCFLYTSLVVVGSFYTPSALWPVIGVMFFLSDHFLSTVTSPRPMVLAIGLGLWIVHWLIQAKEKKLWGASLVYGWLHITAPLVIVYGLIIKVYRLMFKKKMAWRLIIGSGLAILISFVLHPNFPNNWFYFYLNGILVPFFAVKWGVLELGAEFFPLTTQDYLGRYPLIVFSLLSMVLIAMLSRPKTRKSTQLWFLINAVFLIMGLSSQRYIAHGYPLMILSLSTFLTDWYRDKNFPKLVKKLNKWVNVVMLGGMILGLLMLANSLKRMVLMARGERMVGEHYMQMAGWFKENVPSGELIFTANWSDPQYFIGLNPQNNYFVVLDPVYMWHKNPQAYQLYRQIALGQLKDPYAALKDGFKVNYGYAGKTYFNGLVEQVRKDDRFVVVKEDQLGVIFKLK